MPAPVRARVTEPAAGNGASAGPAGEDVIDAEFKEAK